MTQKPLQITADDIIIKNLFLPEYLKKIVIDTGDWSFTQEQAKQLKQKILSGLKLIDIINSEELDNILGSEVSVAYGSPDYDVKKIRKSLLNEAGVEQ